jgi:hypothetical protein
MTNMRCFVIGNGTSRQGIDLTKLNDFTIGCNALYRDFAPDILVAMDRRMQEEIRANYKPPEDKWIVFYDLQKQKFEVIENGASTIAPMEKHDVDAGILAISSACCENKFSKVYLLGMDCYSTGNIYDGTSNYMAQIKPNEKKVKKCVKRLKSYLNDNTKFITKAPPGLEEYQADERIRRLICV